MHGTTHRGSASYLGQTGAYHPPQHLDYHVRAQQGELHASTQVHAQRHSWIEVTTTGTTPAQWIMENI